MSRCDPLNQTISQLELAIKNEAYGFRYEPTIEFNLSLLSPRNQNWRCVGFKLLLKYD